MGKIIELINSNAAFFFGMLYLVSLVAGIVSFLIYKKCCKREDEKNNVANITQKEHEKISSDILLAESFGNEPLSKYTLHTVINNGAAFRKKEDICLVSVLTKGEGCAL